MTIVQALSKVPDDQLHVQSLQKAFVSGTVKRNFASITFAAKPERVLQLNAAALTGCKVKYVGMVIWVDVGAWKKANSPLPERPVKRGARR